MLVSSGGATHHNLYITLDEEDLLEDRFSWLSN